MISTTVCVYVFMYVCMCVGMYVCSYVCMYVCMLRRRLTKKTNISAPQSTVAEERDELDVLLAGTPGGKLIVSRDSYHSLPPSVQGAFKRGDARIVVAEDEGCQSSASTVADSLLALPRTRTPLRGAASASTS